ncbi:ACBD4 protein, partial [Polyodon spathula]|nr:ACBD4 protein [Polyodon spathula]
MFDTTTRSSSLKTSPRNCECRAWLLAAITDQGARLLLNALITAPMSRAPSPEPGDALHETRFQVSGVFVFEQVSGAAMAVADQDCERRFQAAVSVVHSLPKNGLYQPSHKVMLRFYSFYKQATCGPCTAPRPGFWDPIGRYKDAWKRLGDTSREGAMREYVEEMKRVIDTVPMNEKTASMFHHFQPLYRVIHDMPRPPDTLLQQIGGEEGAREGGVI